MRRIAFVICLFLMAAAALLLALIGQSWGWFIGGVVLLAVAIFAGKRLRDEAGEERTEPSGRFALIAMGVTLLGTVFLLWIQSR